MPVNVNQPFNNDEFWKILNQNLPNTILQTTIGQLEFKLKMTVKKQLQINQTCDFKQTRIALKQIKLLAIILKIQQFETQIINLTLNEYRYPHAQNMTPAYQNINKFFNHQRTQLIQQMTYSEIITKLQNHDMDYFNHYLKRVDLIFNDNSRHPIKNANNYLKLILKLSYPHMNEVLQLTNYNPKIDALKIIGYYRRTIHQIINNLTASSLMSILIEPNAQIILEPLIQFHFISYDELINSYNNLGFLLETNSPLQLNQTSKFFAELNQLKNNYPLPVQKRFINNPNLEIVNDINHKSRLLVKKNDTQLDLTDYLLQTLPVTLPNILKQLKRFRNA